MNRKKILISITIFLFLCICGISLFIYQFWRMQVKVESFLNESLNKIEKINSLKYQLSSDIPGDKSIVWMKRTEGKEKIRIERYSVTDSDKIMYINLWDSKEGLLFFYSPESGIAKSNKVEGDFHTTGSKDNFQELFRFLEQNNPKITGKENLDGKECLIIETLSGENSLKIGDNIELPIGGPRGKHWIWIEYGLPIRNIYPTGKIAFVMDNIEINIDIPDEMFKLPESVEITPFSP